MGQQPLVPPREELLLLLLLLAALDFFLVSGVEVEIFLLHFFHSSFLEKSKSSETLSRSLQCQPTTRPLPLREGASTTAAAAEETPLSRPLPLERCRRFTIDRKPSSTTVGSTQTPRCPPSGPSLGTSRRTPPRRRSRLWCSPGVRESRERERKREKEKERERENISAFVLLSRFYLDLSHRLLSPPPPSALVPPFPCSLPPHNPYSDHPPFPSRKNKKKQKTAGVNEDGQLGLDGAADVLSPKVVEALLGTRLRGRAFNRCPLVAGSRCTLALDAEGRVLAWGWNARGTLGHGPSSSCKQQQQNQQLRSAANNNNGNNSVSSSSSSSSAERKPRRVSALLGSRIVQAATGGWHCLALDSEGGAWAWVSSFFVFFFHFFSLLGIWKISASLKNAFFSLPFFFFPVKTHFREATSTPSAAPSRRPRAGTSPRPCACACRT